MNKEEAFEIPYDELEKVRRDVVREMRAERDIARFVREPSVRQIGWDYGAFYIQLYKFKTQDQVNKVNAFVKSIREEGESFDLNE